MKRLAKLSGLERCAIIRRENRFVVTVENDCKIKHALLRNTGRLHDLIQNGYTALCRDRDVGKTDCELIGVLIDDERAALIDTYTQARMFELATSKKLIPLLAGWSIDGKEVTVNGSRLDYKIASDNRKGYLELKSAAYCDGYYAMYPDCPSERGLRHVNALEQLKLDGYRSVIAFVAAHPNAKAFKPNAEGDKVLATKIGSAYRSGVEVHAVKIFLDANGNVFLVNPDLPVEL